MTVDTLIEVERASKKFCRQLHQSLRYGLHDMARELVGRSDRARLRPDEFWALHDVSFSLRRGESLAVIGANGAGKSTLVKMLGGQLRPDTGRITVRGRMAAIRTLGVGFDPLLSGRENIFTNAALLGMSPHQTQRMLDDIINFTGLREHIDAPVLTYSSGMKARLGYGVAAHLDPDVLLLDEVLAVGDFDFKRKCIRHIQGFLGDGGSLVLISHDLYSVQTLCPTSLYLDAGRVAFYGPTNEAVQRYLDTRQEEAERNAPNPSRATADESHRNGSEREDGESEDSLGEERPVVIERIALVPVEGGELKTGHPARVVVDYRSSREIDGIPWGFQICTRDLMIRVAVGFGALESDGQRLRTGHGQLSSLIPSLPLLPGTYALQAAITEPGSRAVLALFGYEDAPATFRVASSAIEIDNRLRTSGALISIETRAE